LALFIILLIVSCFNTKTVTKTGLKTLDAISDRLTKLENLVYKSYASDGANLNNYMYRDSQVQQDVFRAYQANIIRKVGNPSGWDETSYVSSTWNGRRILRIGLGAQANGNGLVVNIPSGYDVLWFRCLNDRYTHFRVSPYAGANDNFEDTDVEVYGCGNRGIGEISPDGAEPDTYYNVHMWTPIPLRKAGKYIVYSDASFESWISGVAFGKNLWNHARNPAKIYQLAVNGGSGVQWWSDNWNWDQGGLITLGIINELTVPIICNGKDKIIYVVQINNVQVGTQHGDVFINDVKVERLRSTYNNAFAVHFNSHIYNKYIATRMPGNLCQRGDLFATLRIDMTLANDHLYFREAGSHDYF